MVGPQQIYFGEVALLFICQEHSVFHSYRSTSVLLFLLLLLAFIFRLDFCSDLVISLYQGVFLPLVHVGFHQKSWVKKIRMVLEKRKSFMQKSGTKRSLFRLRLRLFHVVLDVFLIVCLVIFCCSMTCLKWLRLRNEPLKKSCAIFIIWKHYFGFLLDALFGLTWRMLTHVRLIQSRHSLYDHLVFDFWCHFILHLMLLCRFAWLWSLLLS
jgi:hypothetical protein